jgi:hypothetical protein
MLLITPLFVQSRESSYDCGYAVINTQIENASVKDESNEKTIGTLKKDDVFSYCNERGNNWFTINSLEYGDELFGGRIEKTDAHKIKEYRKIKLQKQNNFQIFLKKNDVSIFINLLKFIPDKKNFIVENNTIKSINGSKNYEGICDSFYNKKYPVNSINSIDVKINGKNISIPERDIENIYNLSPKKTHAFYDEKEDSLYIFGSNEFGGCSDNSSGSYEIVWIIKNGKYVKKHFFVTP